MFFIGFIESLDQSHLYPNVEVPGLIPARNLTRALGYINLLAVGRK
jgi:hypothetical protein